MSDLVVIALAVLVVIVAGLALVGTSRTGRTLPVVARRLMTAREREVLPLIEAAIPHCRVHAQVAMGALIDGKKGLSRKEGTAVRNRFDRKRVDFVLEDRSTGDVLALVELDDRTHNQAKDKARDEITAAAGYLTIRLRAGSRLDQATVHDAINAALAQAKLGEPVGSAAVGRRELGRRG
jgi:hypothetical protein